MPRIDHDQTWAKQPDGSMRLVGHKEVVRPGLNKTSLLALWRLLRRQREKQGRLA